MQAFSAENLTHLVSTGFGSLSYRLYTELTSESWHWNPVGSLSGGNQGYWTSSLTPPPQGITDSSGVALSRRGMTGAWFNPSPYSRLDDGDASTIWKSNPYLDATFTGDSNAIHPQWIVADLGRKANVNAIRIVWADPYATKYRVQYWTGPDAIYRQDKGNWLTFPFGNVTAGAGGTITIKLAKLPIAVRYVRMLTTASSKTCVLRGSHDVRDCRGFAVGEVSIGMLSATGGFSDYVRHTVHAAKQTPFYVSSSDPWESPASPAGVEEPGLDHVFRSGFAQGNPAIVPVSMLYGTPESAANEIRYLESRKYSISYVEMGEEPDGQLITPEDYGALYLQWARAIHAVDASVKLGGPVFQGVNSDIMTWDDGTGVTSWTRRFLTYLSAHGALSALSFFSFEHYPFSGCAAGNSQLLREPARIATIMQVWRSDGVPTSIPWLVTEYNYSYLECEDAVNLTGALWMSDFIGEFASLGGAGSFYYQAPPRPLGTGSSFGAFSMFLADSNSQWSANFSQYYAAWLAGTQWIEPDKANSAVYPVRWPAIIDPRTGEYLVTAYAVNRPDGTWAVLVLNKDPLQSYTVPLVFADRSSHRTYHFAGAVDSYAFSSTNYVWHPGGSHGYADPNMMPTHVTLSGPSSVTLPAYSVTVLRGHIR